MRGKFDYHKNCSLVHHIPSGETLDGMPIIIIPKNPAEVVAGKTYDFLATPTQSATYIIDGKTYRVVHALHLMESDGDGANFIDVIRYAHTPAPPRKLGDTLEPDTRDALLALKKRLSAR